jgi:hypothetical protein
MACSCMAAIAAVNPLNNDTLPMQRIGKPEPTDL